MGWPGWMAKAPAGADLAFVANQALDAGKCKTWKNTRVAVRTGLAGSNLSEDTMASEKTEWLLPITQGASSKYEKLFAGSDAKDLKRRSARGATVSIGSQAAKFALRTGSMMLLARLLTPADFGLQGMIVAMTGFLTLFKDVGLSTVTVQRDVVTHDETSTLFWINALIGALLAGLLIAASPVVASFYREPPLYWMTIVSASAFLFNGLAVQHLALLQRKLKFVPLAIIDVVALSVSAGVGIGMAMLGFRYWSLVGMVVAEAVVTTIASWMAMPWLPGLPTRCQDLRLMLRFGGILTANSLVVFLAYNFEKILLGRFLGAETLGLYGRGYQLARLPTDQVTMGIAGVAVASLSKVQNEPQRLCNAFLTIYAAVVSISIPITVCCAIFSSEIVRFVLGPAWGEAAVILRLLTPAIFVFTLINPLAWLMIASGRVRRSLNIALLIAPCMILGVMVGIRFGPSGVAVAFSTVMVLLVVPIMMWAPAGTPIKLVDLWKSIMAPLLAGIVAGAIGTMAAIPLRATLPSLLVLLGGSGLIFSVYALLLVFAFGRKDLYHDLVRQVFDR